MIIQYSVNELTIATVNTNGSSCLNKIIAGSVAIETMALLKAVIARTIIAAIIEFLTAYSQSSKFIKEIGTVDISKGCQVCVDCKLVWEHYFARGNTCGCVYLTIRKSTECSNTVFSVQLDYHIKRNRNL